MNLTLTWLLILPVVLGLIIFIVKKNDTNILPIIGMYVAACLVVVLTCFFISKGSKIADVEIWNGQVTSKHRIHDEYQQAYQCNCITTTDSKGQSTTTCQTCYEDHYTVEWMCKSTIGDFRIKKLDKTTRRVYNTPDPARYLEIQNGDPVAKTSMYTNYIQAVPNSLFTPAATDLKKTFNHLIPKYPDLIYDYYKVDRFLTPGWVVPDQAWWNTEISNGLRELGVKKQVNVIIVIAKTNDPNYEYALRDAWEGVNKNDVVVVIGSQNYPKIDFVRIISWTKNESFKVQLRDELMDQNVVNKSMVQTIMKQIDKNFERRHMAEFKYLEGEIDPPEWLILMLIVAIIFGAVGVFIFLNQESKNYRSRF